MLQMPNMKNWIPRKDRWTNAERQAKRIEAQNTREFAKMLWESKEEMRKKIHEEIDHKILAKMFIWD